MKVLIITEGYFPGNNYGGPPVSINNLCRLLKDKADFFIITKDHDFKNRKRYDNITDGWNKSPEASILYCNDSKYNYNTFVDSIIKFHRILYTCKVFFKVVFYPFFLQLKNIILRYCWRQEVNCVREHLKRNTRKYHIFIL